jgi:hypothetical protein
MRRVRATHRRLMKKNTPLMSSIVRSLLIHPGLYTMLDVALTKGVQESDVLNVSKQDIDCFNLLGRSTDLSATKRKQFHRSDSIDEI